MKSHDWLRALCVLTVFSSAALSAQTAGDTAPAFTLDTLDGSAVRLADFAGHPVVINFWGTWCPPCRDEIPLVVAAYQAHHDAGWSCSRSTGGTRKLRPAPYGNSSPNSG
jgi:thiol-disulfide isomerase/thioredoxin